MASYLEAFAGAELRQLDLLHIEQQIYGVASSSKAPAPAVEKAAPAPKKEEKPAVVAEAPKAPEPAKAAAKEEKKEEDEDDIDLFGSDDEVDEEAEKIKQQRLKEYAEKKAAKPAVTAKSQVILDVKPWDDETNMDELTKNVLAIEMDGLLWGNHKLVAVGYGIKKLQIAAVVEDEKVSIDELSEKIAEDEDHVQSVDVAAFNKL